MQHKVVVIAGPTASGKSDMSLYLAERFPLEVVNFDSMQVYRYMDIGTAKPSLEKRNLVPHHLYDIRNPDEQFSAYEFIREAGKVVQSISERGKTPLFVGGTGLYIRSYLRGLDELPSSSSVRKIILDRADRYGVPSLHEELKQKDPDCAKNISCYDKHRIVRALEVISITGDRYSVKRKAWNKPDKRGDALFIALSPERSQLYERINRRVDRMLSSGFTTEVENLLQMGYSPGLKSLQSLGYRHIIAVLLEKEKLHRSMEAMKRDTRRYAKRQITWFRREDALWFEPEEREKISKLVDSFLI